MLLSPEVTCEHALSLCYVAVGSMNVELERQKCNEFFALVKEVFTSVVSLILNKLQTLDSFLLF